MEEFTIKGDGNLITIIFDEVYGFPNTTCFKGGYDVRATIIIKSGSFNVKSIVWISTGETFSFLQSLKKCNSIVRGEIAFIPYEGNFELQVTYDDMGHVNLKGEFSEFDEFDNKLKFEFNTDQSYVNQTIKELELIAIKYGGMEGLK